MTDVSRDCLLKTPAVLGRVQVSRATLYRLLARNEFPQGHRIGSGRTLRWLESDIDKWLASFSGAAGKAA
jgi:prophage regulatory protein